MCIRVAINGFGRIGRTVMRIAEENLNDDIEIVALNARADDKTLAHLFKYDSCFGIFNGKVETKENILIINNKEIKIFREDTPDHLPWKELDIDIVIESTGIFKTRDSLMSHIRAGAKKVILTAPADEEDITIVMGVNENDYDNNKHNIISNAFCTTNCLAPVVKILDDKFGIEKGLITTIHSYTNDRKMLDKTHKDLRRARAAGTSIIDGLSTMVIEDNMVKIEAWYDNEWGYSARVVDLLNFTASHMLNSRQAILASKAV